MVNIYKYDASVNEILEDQQREPCEGILTKKEYLQALKTMEKGKSAGCEGFPVEFYQCFGQISQTCMLTR